MHGATQKSLGQVTLVGLRKPDAKVVVELEYNEVGPHQFPGKYLVGKFLRKI